VGFAGALVGGRGTVAVRHGAGAPAGHAYEVGLAAALGEPLMGEGVAKLVGCSPGRPASSPRCRSIWTRPHAVNRPRRPSHSQGSAASL
jgi:hypothetical protein